MHEVNGSYSMWTSIPGRWYDEHISSIGGSTDGIKPNLPEQVHTSNRTVRRTETIPAVPQFSAVGAPDSTGIWLSMAHMHLNSVVRSCSASQNLENMVGEVDLAPDRTLQRKEGSIFLRQCNFKEMVLFLSFRNLQNESVELTFLTESSNFSKRNRALLQQPRTGATGYDASDV